MTEAESGSGQAGSADNKTALTDEPSNTSWYKSIVVAVGFASIAALAVAARPLISIEVPAKRDADLWLLSASYATSFDQIGSWFNASTEWTSLAVGFMQFSTVLILILSGTIFVWRNAGLFARQASRGKTLFEIAIVACILASCSISTSTVWGFRVFGAAAGIFWLGRAILGYREAENESERRLFGDPLFVYVLYIIPLSIAFVWTLAARGSPRWLGADIVLTIIPFGGAVVWTLVLNLILGASVSAAISSRGSRLLDWVLNRNGK